MKTYLSLLARRPDFRRLWAADVASALGTWMSYIAISVLVVQQDGSALALALVFVVHTLPHALLAPIAGPVADRFDRRDLMVVGDVVRGVVTLGMVAAAWAGHLVLLQALLLVRVSVGAFHMPAARAALPRVVEPEELEDANTLGAITWSVLFAAGVALGGVVSAFLGPVPALAADAVTFFVAAAIVRRLPSLRAEGRAARSGRLVVAWRYATERPHLLRAVLAKMPIALAGGGAWVALNLVGFLVSGALAIGALHFARAVGSGVGPYVLRRLSLRGPQLDGVAFVGVLGFAASQDVAWLALSAFAWGVGSGANWVWTTTAMQRLAPDALRGRIGAVDVLLSTFGMALGAVVGGLVVDWTARPGDAALAGAVLGLTALAAAHYMGRDRTRLASSPSTKVEHVLPMA